MDKLDQEEEKATSQVDVGAVLEHHDEKKLVRKIDRHLMPLMFTAYMLQFLDKTVLGYTTIFGLLQSLELTNNEYSWTSSAFYFGFLVASYPVSICFVKLPLGKFLSLSFIVWAVVLICHGAAQGFASLMALRVLLGMLESTISPGLSLVTGMWYKRSEHPLRHGIWFAGNSVSSIFGGLLGYGIGHIHDSLTPWRWLFIIFGLITLTYGIVFSLFLPDSPLTARFLSQDEREFAYQRSRLENPTRSVSHKWSRTQFWEALRDPQTWLLFTFTLTSCIPNGGLTSFGSLVIEGFGFSVLDTLLVAMPSSIFTLIWLVLSTAVTSKVRKSRCITAAFFELIAIAGALMVYKVDPTRKISRLAGIWIFGAFSVGIPISLSLISSNVTGYTKKTTVSAIMFIGYCTGNIIGPFLFFADQAPTYESAWLGILISLGLSAFSILLLRCWYDFQNRRRDRQQGVKISPESAEHQTVDLDTTDWESPTFRYYL